MELSKLRDYIDHVDRTIAGLLNERARLVREIGLLKKDLGIEIYQPDREKEVLNRVRSIGEQGFLGPNAMESVFERVIEVCRNLEGEER